MYLHVFTCGSGTESSLTEQRGGDGGVEQGQESAHDPFLLRGPRRRAPWRSVSDLVGYFALRNLDGVSC